MHSRPVATFYSTNGDEDECGAKWKQMDFPTPMQEVEQQAQISNSFHTLLCFTGILINKCIDFLILCMTYNELMFLVDGLGVLCNSPEVLKCLCSVFWSS